MASFKKLFLFLVLGSSLLSCSGTIPALKETQNINKSLAIVFTNSTRGALEPEGCCSRHQGGLSRRSGFIEDAKKRYPSVMVFDSGNLLFEKDDRSGTNLQKKADCMLSALKHMSTDVINVSSHDCAAGISWLKEQGSPLISANILDIKTDKPVFRPYVFKTSGNRKTGIFGLSDYGNPLKLKAEGVYIGNPLQSAQNIVKELQHKGCRMIILLSQLSEVENNRIARQVPGIHFVLGSSSKNFLQPTAVEGTAAIFSPGTDGKHIAVLEVFFHNNSDLFYNIKNRDAVIAKIKDLREKKQHSGITANQEKIILKQALLQERLQSFAEKNPYKYSVTTLDSKITSDPEINLFVEKYSLALLKEKLPEYVSVVDIINVSDLTEEKKLMAYRLMNDIACDEEETVASGAANKFLCRKLAQIIVSSLKKGEKEGRIRYTVLYEREKQQKQKRAFE